MCVTHIHSYKLAYIFYLNLDPIENNLYIVLVVLRASKNFFLFIISIICIPFVAQNPQETITVH